MGTNPRLLNPSETDDLLEAAARGDYTSPIAVERLVEAFTPLARSIASKYGQAGVRDDAEAAATFEFLAVIRRHKRGTTGFAAYAKTCMRGAARREVRRCGPQRVDIAWSKTSLVSGSVVVDYDDVGWGGGATEGAVRTLKAEQQGLLWERYGEDLSLAEMAKRHGCTESAVSQRLKTAEKAIRRVLVA